MKATFKKGEFGSQSIRGEGKGGGQGVCVGERDSAMVSPMQGMHLGEKILTISELNMWSPGSALASWGTQKSAADLRTKESHTVL